MNLSNDAYDAALTIFEQAVKAFCQGATERGDSLLDSLDREAIERDRKLLSEFARTARPAADRLSSERGSRSIPLPVKEEVQRRDRYHCRFTGRRLIDTLVFREVGRISSVFHFDEHHSVRETPRGAPGHPLVRTHGAAYEHAEPLSCGGKSDVSNIVQTSVQLNESKGARVLPQVDVPVDDWKGLTEYLDALREQPSTSAKKTHSAVRPASRPSRPPRVHGAVPDSRRRALSRMREAAAGIPVTVLALEDDHNAEEKFSALRRTEPNAYFATQTKDRTWRLHRLHCSSLAFNGAQKLTASPKVYAPSEEDIRTWAQRFGAAMTECSRCRRPK